MSLTASETIRNTSYSQKMAAALSSLYTIIRSGVRHRFTIDLPAALSIIWHRCLQSSIIYFYNHFEKQILINTFLTLLNNTQHVAGAR